MKRNRTTASILAFGAAILLVASCQSPGPAPGDPLARPVIEEIRLPDGSILRMRVPPAPPESRIYGDFATALMASLSSEPDLAAERYARVLATRPDDSSLTERAVFFALIAGDYEGARAVASGAPAGVAEQVSLVKLVRGVEAFRQGRTADVAALMRGDRLGPFNTLVADGVAAWAILDAQGLKAARAAITGQRTGDAVFDGVNLYMLGLIELAAGEDDAALQTFEATWDTGLRLAIAAEAHARLLASRGQTDRAMQIIETFRREVGQNPSIERLAAEIASGQPVTVGRLTAREGAALAIYAPAAALAQQSEDDLAGVYFTLALTLDPNLHVARTLWGDALDRAGRRDEAIRLLSEVPEASEFYANARAQLAWVYRREERNDEALSTAQDALALRPDRDLRIQLGDLFRSLGNDVEAESIFSEVIAADEAAGRPDWRLYYARGTARERLGNWEAAEADLRRALSIEPERPEVMNYLGYSLVDRGRKLEEAFGLIRRAVAARPNAGYIVDSLGWAYYRLGRYAEAVEELEKAVVLSPGDPTINDHLGDALYMVGRRQEARYQWERALTLGPSEKDAERIRSKLGRGLRAD